MSKITREQVERDVTGELFGSLDKKERREYIKIRLEMIKE